MMTKLDEVYREQGQSIWIDNLKREYIQSGELNRLAEAGIRGVTSNPTIFEKAIAGSDLYNDQFMECIKKGMSTEEAYWELVVQDVIDALKIMRRVYDNSNGGDGFVSLEVSPKVALDTEKTTEMARHFHELLKLPNLMVKIPATRESIPSIKQMISEGRNINVTLIFSLPRYEEVIEAYLSGLEACEGDLSNIASVASFFVSRVDTEVDSRLDAIGTDEALALKGKAAVAQARLAYKLFEEKFSGPRWEALAARGAKVQRPLWASTSTKNPDYPDLLYVDTLIGPHTVNTMPDATVTAFLDHGIVARTVDAYEEAQVAWDALAAVGIDLDDVAQTLEDQGVENFGKSFDSLLDVLQAKAIELGANA